MAQIPDKSLKSVAAPSDMVLIRDLSSNTDKRTTVSGLAAGVAPSLPNSSVSSVALVNPFRFSAYCSAAVPVPSGVFTKVPFQTEDYDIGNIFDPTTSRCTVTVPGYYRIDAGVTLLINGVNRIIATIYKNGVEFKRLGETVTNSGNGTNGISGGLAILLNVGDYIEIFTNSQSISGTVFNQASLTWISGYLESAN